MDRIMPVDAVLPRYRCHKEVWALKIAAIDIDKKNYGGFWIITPDDKCYTPFQVDNDYVTKHAPQVGGYYVVYADGYKSYSPAKAFEDGYSLIS